MEMGSVTDEADLPLLTVIFLFSLMSWLYHPINFTHPILMITKMQL